MGQREGEADPRVSPVGHGSRLCHERGRWVHWLKTDYRGFRSCIWLWTVASRIWEPWDDLNKGITCSELCWNNIDNEKSERGLNGSFCQAA